MAGRGHGSMRGIRRKRRRPITKKTVFPATYPPGPRTGSIRPGIQRSSRTGRAAVSMNAARVLRFGPPSVITIENLPQPEPSAGQLLVRVKAAGVGDWDALIREGKVELQPLPLILGSELSGIIEG